MMKFDISTTSVVVTCTDCPHWYAFTWDKHHAYTSAESHQTDVHDIAPSRAADARRAATRRAAKSVVDFPEYVPHGNPRALRSEP